MRQIPLNVFRNITLTPDPWDTEYPCWIWDGAKTDEGYGVVKFEGKTRLVSRLVYELLKEPIPKGLVLYPLCRVRACCNLKHHKVVTRTEATRLRDEWAAELKKEKRRAKKEMEEKRRLELRIADDDCCV